MKNPSIKNETRPTLSIKKISEDILEVVLTGNWSIEGETPSVDIVLDFIEKTGGIHRVVFNSDLLLGWDSSLLSLVLEIHKRCKGGQHLVMELEGLPHGVKRLVQLATAVPKKEDARKTVTKEPFLAKVGSDVQDFMSSAEDLIAFVGEAFVAFFRLLTGRARFRVVDFMEFLQDTGARAVPIVSLISFLVGLILAFVGILQLNLFGASIYVADLVSIAMVREMGAIMTGIIMAGRTGAAFAAQLGTMQVNEEIDALHTLSISPVEFLVLPRMMALTVMMPLLVIYADILGILGGAVVAVGVYDISMVQYFGRVKEALGFNHLFIGLFMGLVFGVLVALSGCMRGMQCGRSASEVGDSATSAVVTGIVAIIIATAIITILCDIIGI
jgi:phospholipid/cholesterol/gamma-HCH transport system permease protein